MRRFALIAFVAGCVTPSIPIPPPEPSKMVFVVDSDASSAVFTYPPDDNYVGATVFLYDRNLGEGIITRAHDDGSVGPTDPVRANLGDQIVVTFQRDEDSASSCIRLRDGAQSGIDACD